MTTKLALGMLEGKVVTDINGSTVTFSDGTTKTISGGGTGGGGSSTGAPYILDTYDAVEHDVISWHILGGQPNEIVHMVITKDGQAFSTGDVTLNSEGHASLTASVQTRGVYLKTYTFKTSGVVRTHSCTVWPGNSYTSAIDNYMANKPWSLGTKLSVGSKYGPQATAAGLIAETTSNAINSVINILSSTIEGGTFAMGAAFLAGGSLGNAAVGAYGRVTMNRDYRSLSYLSFAGGGTTIIGGMFAAAGAGGIAGNFAYSNSSTFSMTAERVYARSVDICNSSYGIQLFGSQIGSFTGAHDALYPKSAKKYELGDILVDVEVKAKPNVNDSVTAVAVSDSPRMKSVIGVVSSFENDDHVPSALSETHSEFDADGNQITINGVAEQYKALTDDYHFITVNAVGEGCVNVCGENGDFEIGDLIVTSSMRGKGMRQDDDIVRSCTVAKIRESVKFATPTEVKFVACVYMCG